MLRSRRFLLIAVSCIHLHGCSGSSNSNPSPNPVTPVNPTPMANADTGNADNGSAVALAVLGNDVSPVASTLRISGFTQPAHGMVTQSDGVLNYVPEAGFYGQDQFTYTLSDSANRTATGQVVIQSRIKFALRGLVEGNVTGARVQLNANGAPASFTSVGGLYSLDLITTNADAVVRLEAQGSGADAFMHFAVLLGRPRELLALAKAQNPQAPALDNYPRLRLGVVGTAEYGMLRELASAEELLDAGKLQRLQAFVDGEALLERAVLIERALANPAMRTVASSLILASDPVALSGMRSPTGSQGSGGVANEGEIALAKASLRSNSAYYSSTQSLQNGASWISNDPQNRNSRMFLVNRWLGDRLDNHERLRMDVGSTVVRRQPLSSSVNVVRSEHQILLAAPDQGGLGFQLQCDGANTCEQLSRTTTLTLRPFFDRYLRVSANALFANENTPRLLSDQLATLAPGYARNQPAQVMLSLCGNCTDSGDNWVTDRVQFDSDGRFSQVLIGQPTTLQALSGRWEPRAGTGPMLLDSVSGDQHLVDWIAESAGRSLAIITRRSASSGTRVVLSEWAELPATNPSLPSSISRCDPVVDGYLLGRSLSSTAVPGERLQLLPNGQYMRSFNPVFTAQSMGVWMLQPDALSLAELAFTSVRFLPRLQLPDNQWLLLETRRFTRTGLSNAEPVEFSRLSVPRLFRCI